MSTGYDLLLEQIGRYGPYQKRKLLYMYFAPVILFMPRVAWIFLGATPAHRCLLPFEELGANYTLSPDILNNSVPWDSTNQQWSQCVMLDPNGGNEIKCERFVYDTSEYQSSAVVEWDLVCDRSWMKATAQSVFEGGLFCGATILGILSDKIGRKTTLCGAIMLQMSVGMLAGVMPEFYSFIVLRFIVGSTSAAVATVFILGVELLGPKDRLIPGIVFNYFFSIGYLLFGVYAYFITDWRWLNTALHVTGLVLIPYWWVLPESNRWLIVKGKLQQAQRNVLEAAKMNKRDIDPITVDQILRETQRSGNTDSGRKLTRDKTFRDVLRHPQIRFIALNLCFIWFACNAVYWGLSFNVSNLGGKLLLNFLISGAVEFPGYTSLFFFDKYMGRRTSLAGLFLVTGSMLIATTIVPADMVWLNITFAMGGKMAISAAYGLIYIYTTELYPTIVRNAGMGVASTSARVGGMTAPYVLLLADTWKPLPMIIYGCIAVIGGLLGLLLPETKGKPLPETLEDLDSKKKSVEEVELANKLLNQ